MKVVHLATGNLQSGAGSGAKWLHRALRRMGVDSELHCSRVPSPNEYEEKLCVGKSELNLKVLSKLDKVPMTLLRQNAKRNFSTGFAGINLASYTSQIDADIIHLHFINSGYVSSSSLAKVKKPIVWTLRDMWPFTGGCHYSWDCFRYEEGCGFCPVLGSVKKKDLSWSFCRTKKSSYSQVMKLQPVAISPWLKRCADNSLLFEDHTVEMIWNGVDLSNFEPIDRTDARRALGLDERARILLLGASHASSILKGYDRVLSELALYQDKYQFQIVRFGHIDDSVQPPMQLHDFGYVEGRKKLNLLYAAADVFLAPSPQEAFGKTIVEAFASGTPVVAFNGSGPSDMIDSAYVGELVEQGNFPQFAQKSLQALDRFLKLPNARKKCVERSRVFSDTACADSYLRLYEALV